MHPSDQGSTPDPSSKHKHWWKKPLTWAVAVVVTVGPQLTGAVADMSSDASRIADNSVSIMRVVDELRGNPDQE